MQDEIGGWRNQYHSVRQAAAAQRYGGMEKGYVCNEIAIDLYMKLGSKIGKPPTGQETFSKLSETAPDEGLTRISLASIRIIF